MNDKEQRLYNRIKMIVSTTACEFDMPYSDIENALIRVYEEEHSETAVLQDLVTKKDTEKVKVIDKNKKSEESEVEKTRARARAYYHKHKAKILAQRKAENKNESNEARSKRTKFNPQIIKLMTENQDLMPQELSNKIKQELGIEVLASAISNWRYNHNHKNKKVESEKTSNENESVQAESAKTSVENFFQ